MAENKQIPYRNTTVMYIACLAMVCMVLSGPTFFKTYVTGTDAPPDGFAEVSRGVLSRTQFSSPEDKAFVVAVIATSLLYVPMTILFLGLSAVVFAAAGWIAYREFTLPAPSRIAAEIDGE